MKTPAELQKELGKTVQHIKHLMCEIEDRYETELVKQIYHNRNWRLLQGTFESVIKEAEKTIYEQQSYNEDLLSVKQLEAEKTISITKYYQAEAATLYNHLKPLTDNTELNDAVLRRYGFKFHNEDYIRVMHNENSDEEYQTLRLFHKGDHYICYIKSIKLYTLNDLKMLWYLSTREELMEV